MTVHVHQPGHQIHAPAVYAAALQSRRDGTGGNARDALGVDRHRHIGLWRMRAIDQSHVLDGHALCARRTDTNQQGEGACREHGVEVGVDRDIHGGE